MKIIAPFSIALCVLIVNVVKTSPLRAAPGDLEQMFNPNVSGSGSTYVSSAVTQPDGKLLICGRFEFVGGVTHYCLARLNANGSQESAFHPALGVISCIALRGDGKMLIGGYVGGPPTSYLGLFNADGTQNGGFALQPDNVVYCMAVQPDGKILIGGLFNAISGTPRNHLARINTDGTLDATFAPLLGDVTSAAYSLSVQSDGKILVGGGSRNLMRLNGDGSYDATFNPHPGNAVFSIAVQPDGKILVGGSFDYFDDPFVVRRSVARLYADGTVDLTFDPDVADRVSSIGLQTDGKMLIAGPYFSTVSGVSRQGVAKLRADGTLDQSFNPDFVGGAYGLALQADGRIVVTGYFSQVNGLARRYMVRFENEGATQNLTVTSAGRVQWLRGGSAPETQDVAFDLSTDGGTNYIPLGIGTRMPGGWERTGLSLPPSGSVRARARIQVGANNGSSGLVETVMGFNTTPTPYQQWKYSYVGPAEPDLGDPDRDGLATLAEYALLLSPTVPSKPPGASIFTCAEGDRLRMFVPRDPAHNDITVSVEATGDIMAGPWTTLAASMLGAPFTGPGYVGGDSARPGVKTVEVRDLVNLSATAQRWLRVRVTH